MNKETLIQLFNDIRDKKITIPEAVEIFKDLPYKDLDFVKLDYHRDLKKSLGEVIYSSGKTNVQLEAICRELKASKKEKIIFTRVDQEKADLLLSIDNELEYNKAAQIVFKNNSKEKKRNLILVLTAGTSDINIAEEASCIAEIMGNNVEKYFDVGVAGIHRLFAIYDKLQEADVIIAVAGMEGALPTVVSGLVNVPVIALPTSVGYGASLNGLSALLSMLNSCSPGIAVVNIDNGFGAGYLASLIANKEKKI
jgi:pyridinium-3,5-biscarboxylic acid mononucleotide synthase